MISHLKRLMGNHVSKCLPDLNGIRFEDSDNFLNVFISEIKLRIQNLKDHDTLKADKNKTQGPA